MSEIIKLVKDTKYRATVTGITPRGGGYQGTGSNSGKYYNCHHLVVVVDQFPSDLFNLQICDLNHDFNLLDVGDYFVFVAGTYKVAEDRYTIKFESKAFKQQPKKETIGSLPIESKQQKSGSQPHYELPYQEKRLEQAIAGTKWSICLTAAKDFHKDRKTSKDADVISTLKAYMRSFNEYQASEDEYLKESK